MFQVDVDQEGNVFLTGRLDASQQQLAMEAFNRVVRTAVVDCSKLEYISSAGIGVLIATQKRLSAEGHHLHLKNLNAHISEIFRYAGLETIFTIT